MRGSATDDANSTGPTIGAWGRYSHWTILVKIAVVALASLQLITQSVAQVSPIDTTPPAPTSSPLWMDWRFWQIVVTGLSALIGFAAATLFKYRQELRLDTARRTQAKADLAAVLHAETLNIWRRLKRTRKEFHDDLQFEEDGNVPVYKFEWELRRPPQMYVLQSQIDKLGLLPRDDAASLIRMLGDTSRFDSFLTQARDFWTDEKVPTKTIRLCLSFCDEFLNRIEALNKPLAKAAQVPEIDWTAAERELSKEYWAVAE